jgi:hypothetical protein
MNAFLLGLAAAGALVVMATAREVSVPTGEELGWMTREYSLNPITGETEETSIIAFRD